MSTTWHDSPRGGTYCRTSDGYLARPFDRVGMSTIRSFATMAAALAYADTPSRQHGRAAA